MRGLCADDGTTRVRRFADFHIERRFAQNNRKYAADHLEGNARRLHFERTVQLEDYFKEWVGALTDAQSDRIERFADLCLRCGQLRIIFVETACKTRLASDHRQPTEIHRRQCQRRRFFWCVRQRQHVAAIGGKRKFRQRAGKAGAFVDQGEQFTEEETNFMRTCRRYPGVPDGMKLDSEGRVYCTGAGSSIWVFSPAGVKLGEIDEIATTGKSLMPEGFDRLMTPDDLASLIAFLKDSASR